METKVIGALRRNGCMTAEELSTYLNSSRAVITLTLNILINKDKVQKSEQGFYTLKDS